MLALVTGASSGIGRDIARELAKRKYDVIIVARTEKALQELKSELEEEYKVKVYIKIVDLTNKDNWWKIYRYKFGKRTADNRHKYYSSSYTYEIIFERYVQKR